MDCWPCSPCFGIFKKSKRDNDVDGGEQDPGRGMGEREPLLHKDPHQSSNLGPHSRYMATAPDRATGNTVFKGSGGVSDAFRNQLSDILLTLNAGKVPSQGQMSGVLRGVLNSGVLNAQVQSEWEPSEDGSALCRKLIGDMQEVVEAFLDFGVEKNGDDKLQEIYSDITSLTIPLSNGKPSQGREDVSSGAEKLEKRQRATSELEFDTITLLSALRTLALTSLTSPSFRHSLSHFISIITHDDLAAEKSEKEDIVIIVRKIIDRIQSDRASRCAIRAILILARKYAHVLLAAHTTSLNTTIGETAASAPIDSKITIDIPQPALALLKNIKEILERCAGGKSLDPLLSAFVRVAHDLGEEDEKGGDEDQRNDDSDRVPSLVGQEMAEKVVETPGDGEQTPKQHSPPTVPVPAFTPAYPSDTTSNPAPILPVEQPTLQTTQTQNASTPNTNGNGNANGVGNDKKKTNSRNKKKNQKAKMKKRQKAMEKKAQEIKNGSGEGLAESAQSNTEEADKEAGPSTSAQKTATPEGTSTGKEVDVNLSQTQVTQHRPSSSTHKPVSLSAFLLRVGHFLDALLSESEPETECGHTSDAASPVAESQDRPDLQELVDDGLQLFADTKKADSQQPPSIHTLLAKIHQFTHALENDHTTARLWRAADAFRRDIHLVWGSESSSSLSQLVLKRLLRVLPLPLALPLNCAALSLSSAGVLPSRPGRRTTNIPDVVLKMGHWEGVLTDLWVSGASSLRPSMLGGGEGSRMWMMEGAKVVEVSLIEDLDLGDSEGHDEDNNANDDDDENNDNNDDETTTLLSSTKAKTITKRKSRRQSKSTTRTSVTHATYTISDGSTSAACSDPQHFQILPSTKLQGRTLMRLRTRIQVPLTDLGHRQPLHLRAGIENAHYRVHYAGPCSAWVGYEDEGVLDVEFGLGGIETDGVVEVEVDVDVGFEEEREVVGTATNDGDGERDAEEGKNIGEPKQEPKPTTSKKLKSASTLSLYESSISPSLTPPRSSCHHSPSSESHRSTSQGDDNGSAVIPEIIVHGGSSDEDFKEGFKNDEGVSSRAPYTRQNSRPESKGNAKGKGKSGGQRRSKSLKVLSTTIVPSSHLAFHNEEIDITRRESTGHHWPTTDMLMRPLGGSRGELVEQMVRLAVKSWVRGIMEERVREVVEVWIAGFVGRCERLWEVLEKVFGGKGMC